MLSKVSAGRYTVRGISLGGVYTALQVPELDLLFDCGLAPRSFAGTGTLLLSHGHVDHVGALSTLLGIRGLHGQKRALRVVMPVEIVDHVQRALTAMTAMQHWPLEIEAIGASAGQTIELRKDLQVRAFKTFHPVPSLGYQLLRRVKKLKAEHHGLDGPTIAARKQAGEDLFESAEHLELAYATDTLVQVLDHEPSLYRSRVLVIECTFLDDRKSIDDARAGCHIHLDELIARADRFENEQVVLMHVSQLYRPGEIEAILDRRVPPKLRERMLVLAPSGGDWAG